MTAELLAADLAARRAALTVLDRTLLVEAGAGSGKTSVLAGRVVCLLAAGRRPKEIAAITFTELAAGELRERVCTFVAELLYGRVRPDLQIAFPNGPSGEQTEALLRASAELDELVCTTIHGFCQRLLTPYPVEAGMDPGAAVTDRAAADALFNEVLENWLRDRLSGELRSDDLLLTLYADDPTGSNTLLRAIAEAMRKHHGAQVPQVPSRADALEELRAATVAFRSFLHGADCQEPETAVLVQELETLLTSAPGSSASEAERLMHAMAFIAPPSATRKDGEFKAYQKKGKWQAAVKARRSAMTAERLNDQASACYDACKQAHAAIRSFAVSRILCILADEIDGVLHLFDKAKRDRALIDFDDLLRKTRDLLERHDTVRAALSHRYAAVLVDEFQDTDPLQCEILWRLCAEATDPARPWTDWPLRPGALFLVGDPKQAIYRFRGADVASYSAARTRLIDADRGCRLVIGQNFRSYTAILDWVNRHFALKLAEDQGQPGFEPLFSSAEAPENHVAVAALPVSLDGTRADDIRDAEAEALADCCQRIIGALQVRDHGTLRPCQPDDIALLAPTGTDLWRYERALEDRGIAVSTQAGKGFYRRQEVQDLIALTRVLADARDTLALGALLRGPLVGLTEEALLDATAALPATNGMPARLRLWTELAHIHDPLLRETIAILQSLARQARSTTPFVLLNQAVEELQVRPLLRQRQDRTAERALANLDLFLETARAYDVRGLQAFATAMRAEWEEASRTIEGRPDTEEQAVSLVTMHSGKGLEWPVVIPINTGTELRERIESTVDANGHLHLRVRGLHGPGGADAFAAESAEQGRERHRLWYVAATRARDLLLLPQFSTGVPAKSWMEHVGLNHDGLEPFNADSLGASRLYRAEDSPNSQDRAQFETEAALIAARTHRLRRVTPHLAEAGETVALDPEPLPLNAEDNAVVEPIPRGSRARGLVLHKLLEEVLTGEVTDGEAELIARTAELAAQLVGVPGVDEVDPAEAARAVRRGLAIPEIARVRGRLVPECAVAHSASDSEDEVITIGVADAVARDADRVDLVVDWKSDVNPSAATIAQYCNQVSAYLKATNAPKGLVVFVTSGSVLHVKADRGTSA